MTKVLVIDDDRSVRHLVVSGLSVNPEFQVISAADGASGLQLVRDEKPDVALLDVYLPEHNGLELFRQIRALDHKIPVIFITGDRSSETAIEAMRAGAFDYVSKPLNLEQLRRLTTSAAKTRQLMDKPVALTVGEAESGGERFIGNAPEMLEVFKAIGRVSAQAVTVLIRGESGAGKELVARALVHHSDRRDKVFAAVNCAAIPDQLLESELFGHERGAFTGAEKRRVGRLEQCDGGTLFLDEVGDMSPLIQGKVLRILQEQQFERVGGNEVIQTDVRIIAATNRPLEQMVERGEFREDLLYRLNAFTVQLPPLRDRREDIPSLLEYFLRRAKSEMKRPELDGISPEALELLIHYDWPGNVRQLQSVVRQSLLNTTGTVIGPANLPEFVQFPDSKPKVVHSETAISGVRFVESQVATAGSILLNPSEENHQVEDSNVALVATGEFVLDRFIEQRLQEGTTSLYEEVLAQIERRLFTRVLEFTEGNQSKAAEILGITRGKVRDRIATFGIHIDRTVSVDRVPAAKARDMAANT